MDIEEFLAINADTPLQLTGSQVRGICDNLYGPILQLQLTKLLGRMERVEDTINLYPENQRTPSPQTYVHDFWLWFLQEVTVAKIHNAISDVEAPSANTGIASLFLPALLYIRLVTILDEGLIFYMQEKGFTLPPKTPQSLEHRLTFLHNQKELEYTEDLKRVRDKRNGIAHRPTSIAYWYAQQISWQSLDEAINIIEAVMQNLGLIGIRPNYQNFVRRDNIPVPAERPVSSHTNERTASLNPHLRSLFLRHPLPLSPVVWNASGSKTLRGIHEFHTAFGRCYKHSDASEVVGGVGREEESHARHVFHIRTQRN